MVASELVRDGRDFSPTALCSPASHASAKSAPRDCRGVVCAVRASVLTATHYESGSVNWNNAVLNATNAEFRTGVFGLCDQFP